MCRDGRTCGAYSLFPFLSLMTNDPMLSGNLPAPTHHESDALAPTDIGFNDSLSAGAPLAYLTNETNFREKYEHFRMQEGASGFGWEITLIVALGVGVLLLYQFATKQTQLYHQLIARVARLWREPVRIAKGF